MLFGGVMFISVLRFMLRGWVTELYVAPKFYFSYFGFEWVKPFGEVGMYVVFGCMALSCLGIMLGAFYRFSSLGFFLTWTYVELLDVTNYLNHYYFVSIIAFLLIFVPAAKDFSLDAKWWPNSRAKMVPRWSIGVFRLQLSILYFFAGLAKVQSDWLLRAMPLKIWLPAKANLPLIGGLLKLKWVAYIFAWSGCLYDLTIPFFLMMRKTRPFAFAAVVAFHLLTWWLFPIGMFPFIMIASTLIFFPADFHLRLQKILKRILRLPTEVIHNSAAWSPKPFFGKALMLLFGLHFMIQVFMPLRSHLYDGELFWHEHGFRFSWRVMLMEKAGYAIFKVTDPRTGKSSEIVNRDYLTPNQEKMMATQPDMLLQFAHFIEQEYVAKGIPNPEVYLSAFVTLNGSGSRPFTDPKVNLCAEKEGFRKKTWLLPFESPSSDLSLRR